MVPFDTVYSYSNPRRRKLNDDQRHEAVELYEAGWTLQEIADRFGVSASGISYHISQRTILRRDLPPEAREEASRRRREHRRQRA